MECRKTAVWSELRFGEINTVTSAIIKDDFRPEDTRIPEKTVGYELFNKHLNKYKDLRGLF